MSENPKSPLPSTENLPHLEKQEVSTPLWLLSIFLISRYFQLHVIADHISAGIGWLGYFLIFVLGGLMMIMRISGIVFPLALLLAIFSNVPWWWWIVVIVGELEMITRYTKGNLLADRNNDE